ncbi:MAG: glycosyltransferase family 39 protein, partial [Anaerolineae bacterium]
MLWHRAIVLTYLVIGVLFAVYTPAWQAPDEPAHYNYIHVVATQGVLPVLQAGDYNQAEQTAAIVARFGPGTSIEAFRYEFHQPPLYYVLAAPLFRLTGGALLPLRLFSVFLGGLLLLVVHRAAMLIVRPAIALGAMAFVAFLPMHIAMLAAVNNDSLAELLIAIMLWQCLRLLIRPAPGTLWPWLWLGIVTGLGLITKSTVYAMLPLLGVTLLLAWRDSHRHDPTWRRAASLTFAVTLPLLLLALPWWVRNLAVYGGADFLGLNRHEDIVLGQLRTSEFLAQEGWVSLGTRFVTWTFRSFWGQFGWMNILLDSRIYTALLILSLAAGVGAGWALW